MLVLMAFSIFDVLFSVVVLHKEQICTEALKGETEIHRRYRLKENQAK